MQFERMQHVTGTVIISPHQMMQLCIAIETKLSPHVDTLSSLKDSNYCPLLDVLINPY
jgi:hypothetical protein